MERGRFSSCKPSVRFSPVMRACPSEASFSSKDRDELDYIYHVEEYK